MGRCFFMVHSKVPMIDSTVISLPFILLDDHSRFKGDDVILHVTDHEDPDNSYEFLPESYDVFIEFEGVEDDNLIEIRVEMYTKKQRLSVEDNSHKVKKVKVSFKLCLSLFIFRTFE